MHKDGISIEDVAEPKYMVNELQPEFASSELAALTEWEDGKNSG